MKGNNSSYVFLVVLYNKKISDSITIKKLVEYKTALGNSKVVIWNNGPEKVKIDFFDSDFELVETLDNFSLSMIYNIFVDKYISDYYVILDDDSNITLDYLVDVKSLDKENLATPKVTANGNVISPTSLIPKTKEVGLNLRAIGSGLVFSRELVYKVRDFYGDVFDERFYFYGVDTTFIYRITKVGIFPKIINGFSHDISEFNEECANREKFKSKELSYSLGLRIRNYPSILLAKRFIVLLVRTILRNEDRLKLKYVMKALITNRHYRNR